MTTQTTPADFIRSLTNEAMAVCQKNLRKSARGMVGEGKAEAKLPDGRAVVCTYSETVSIYGRSIARSSFTIDGKRASKEQIAVAMGGRTKSMVAEMNPVLRAAFEAQAPTLKADYIAWIRRVYDRLFAKHEGKIPSWVSYKDDDRYAINMLLPKVCNVVNTKDKPINPTHILILNEESLDRVATQYGDDAAVQWFYKTNEKLGKLDDAELLRDASGDVVVKGLREGKKVVMNQQRIIKQSVNGVLFHQFPARIYVEDKFITEAAYKKMFKDEEKV